MKKLVIVEDREDIQLVYELIFNRCGFNNVKITAMVESAEDALQMLPSIMPDLMIIDISLPGMDGIELTRRIKSTYPQIMILIATGHDRDIYYSMAMQAGADEFITKGDGGDFLAKVKAMLDKSPCK